MILDVPKNSLLITYLKLDKTMHNFYYTPKGLMTENKETVTEFLKNINFIEIFVPMLVGMGVKVMEYGNEYNKECDQENQVIRVFVCEDLAKHKEIVEKIKYKDIITLSAFYKKWREIYKNCPAREGAVVNTI